jgi:hypothetical protein
MQTACHRVELGGGWDSTRRAPVGDVQESKSSVSGLGMAPARLNRRVKTSCKGSSRIAERIGQALLWCPARLVVFLGEILANSVWLVGG